MEQSQPNDDLWFLKPSQATAWSGHRLVIAETQMVRWCLMWTSRPAKRRCSHKSSIPWSLAQKRRLSLSRGCGLKQHYIIFSKGEVVIYIHISFSSYNIKVFPMYSKESAMTVESPFFGAVHHEHIRTLNLGECGRRPLRELRRTWMSNW